MIKSNSTTAIALAPACQMQPLEARRLLAIDLVVPSIDLLDTTVVPALVAPGGNVELSLFVANQGDTDPLRHVADGRDFHARHNRRQR